MTVAPPRVGQSTLTDVDVVVVAYRSAAHLRRCLEAIERIPNVGEVVVVDHGDDESGVIARRYGATVLVNSANPGFGAGQNQGIERTRAPYVLLLNPDASPHADAISAGVRYLDAHPQVAVVQGAITDRTSGRPDRSQGRELGPLHLLGRAIGARRLHATSAGRVLALRIPSLRDHVARVPAAPTEVEALAATAWLARRRALESVGGFDERYFLYGEDLDLCRRLRHRRWSLVALPVAWAEHSQGGSAESWYERELAWWNGTLRFAARWWSTPRWAAGITAGYVRWIGLSVTHPRTPGRAWRATVGAAIAERRARQSTS